MTHALGRTIGGRYRLETVLGAGAAGLVYAGVDEHGGARVAVKVLHAELTESEEIAERFQREARALQSIRSPHVVALRAFGVLAEPDLPRCGYLVMDLAGGETLRARLRRGPLPIPEALEALRGAAAGLDAAHASGVVHRDVKPANIVLGPPVQLVDFSVAWVDGRAITHAGQLLGTAAYMAPEQCAGAVWAGPAADIYALGVVAFEVFTGGLPFVGANLVHTLALQQEAPPPRLPGSLAALDAPLHRALAKDPAQRPSSAGRLVEELEWALRGETVHAGPEMATRVYVSAPPTLQLAPGTTPSAAGPRWTTWGLLGALVAGAGVVGAVALRRERPAPPSPTLRAEVGRAVAPRPVDARVPIEPEAPAAPAAPVDPADAGAPYVVPGVFLEPPPPPPPPPPRRAPRRLRPRREAPPPTDRSALIERRLRQALEPPVNCDRAWRLLERLRVQPGGAAAADALVPKVRACRLPTVDD